jgi:hemoglobin
MREADGQADRMSNAAAGVHRPIGGCPETTAVPGRAAGVVIIRRVTAPADRHDIDTRADVERLVRAFYGRALTDPVIGFLFVDVAKLDLEEHVPVITAFWETILLGARSYGGGAFRPHAALNAQVSLHAGHFERWLLLWRTTVDELFTGVRAEEAKAHAQRVARAFSGRLQGMTRAPAAGGGLAVTRHGDPAPSAPSGLAVTHHHGAGSS